MTRLRRITVATFLWMVAGVSSGYLFFQKPEADGGRQSYQSEIALFKAEQSRQKEKARIEANKKRQEEIAQAEVERHRQAEVARIEAERQRQEEVARVEDERRRRDEAIREDERAVVYAEAMAMIASGREIPKVERESSYWESFKSAASDYAPQLIEFGIRAALSSMTGESMGGSRPKTQHVRGYTRQNGTYVQPYVRSAPRYND